jgi:hypothetical protein
MSDVTERETQAGGLPWSEPISLSVSVMLEGWTDGGAPGLGRMGNPLREGVLDLQARSWAEYGPNRGAEHILRVFKRHGVSAVFYVSGIVAESCVALVTTIAEAGRLSPRMAGTRTSCRHTGPRRRSATTSPGRAVFWRRRPERRPLAI